MEKNTSILNLKKEVKIRKNSNVFNINIDSLKKIFSLISNKRIENYILFINDNLDNIKRNEQIINNPIINEIGTIYDENMKNIKKKESDPIIIFIDYYISYLYFLIGSLLLFHLFLILFGPDVREIFYFLV